MFYILEYNERYIGCFTDVIILKNNINFLENNHIINKYNIYQMDKNIFGSKNINLSDLKTHQYKKNIIYILCYNNELFALYDKINIIKKNISFLKKIGLNNEFKIYRADLNSLHFNLEKKIDKIVKDKIVNQEEEDKKAQELFNLNRQLNILKMQKNRLEEKKTKFDNDIKLYNYFKQNIKDNPKFEIPILFKKKFKNLTICEINNNLNFEYYIKNYSDDFLENSYQMLFEGGNKLDNFFIK